MGLSHEKMELNHRALAAVHHDQAANYHHAVSIHFESGKDYAHSSHQAILAHGHSLKALEYGRRATAGSSVDGSKAVPSEQPCPSGLITDLIKHEAIDATAATAVQHHREAPSHSEKAAAHEWQAPSLEFVSDFSAAAHEAAMAEEHSERSLFHRDEAAKHLSL